MTDKKKPLSTEALAGEVDKGSEIQSLPARIDRYGKAKTRQVEIIDHIESRLQEPNSDGLRFHLSDKKRSSIKHCGDFLRFANYYTVDKVRLTHANFCKTHLLCPLCAIRRGSKQVKAYLDKLDLILKEKPHLKLHMVTLTVKNGSDLGERFDHLQKSFKKLLMARRNSLRGMSTSVMGKLTGGVYSYEATYSKEHGWHPHVHMAVLCHKDDPLIVDKRNPKESQLSKEWLKATGDSFIVEAHEVYGDQSLAFIEVFKYALKFSDLTPDQTLQSYITLKGRRLTGAFGDFWGVKVPEELTDEALDDLPYIEMFYRFSGKQYQLHSSKQKCA